MRPRAGAIPVAGQKVLARIEGGRAAGAMSESMVNYARAPIGAKKYDAGSFASLTLPPGM